MAELLKVEIFFKIAWTLNTLFVTGICCLEFAMLAVKKCKCSWIIGKYFWKCSGRQIQQKDKMKTNLMQLYYVCIITTFQVLRTFNEILHFMWKLQEQIPVYWNCKVTCVKHVREIFHMLKRIHCQCVHLIICEIVFSAKKYLHEWITYTIRTNLKENNVHVFMQNCSLFLHRNIFWFMH